MIKVNEAVTLLLPFQCRTLKLSHRLLKSLGGVSRFMLSALGAGLTLEQMTEVTGLPEAALSHQLAFLSQHGFVNALTEGQAPILGERGRRMLEVERLLLRDLLPVWLDTFTLKQQVALLLAGLEPEALQPNPATAGPSLAATMPRRTPSYRHFDEVNRLRTLLDAHALAGVLATFWPGEAPLIQDEQDHWDYELLRTAEPELRYLTLAFPAGGLSLFSGVGGRNPTWPQASLPALELETRFSRDPALPWMVEVPEAEHHLIELVSHGRLGPHWRANELPADTQTVALPACAKGAVPDLPIVALPAGVAAVVKARPCRLTCSLDVNAIVVRLMETHPGQVFCRAGREREEFVR